MKKNKNRRNLKRKRKNQESVVLYVNVIAKVKNKKIMMKTTTTLMEPIGMVMIGKVIIIITTI